MHNRSFYKTAIPFNRQAHVNERTIIFSSERMEGTRHGFDTIKYDGSNHILHMVYCSYMLLFLVEHMAI